MATGSKLLRLTLVDFSITFLDFYKYVPLGLAQLCQTFQVGKQKGFFSFDLFAELDRWQCSTPFPAAEAFFQRQDSPETRQEKIQWQHQHRHQFYDICDEAVKYCQLDVDCLMMCALKFLEQSLHVQNLLHQRFGDSPALTSAKIPYVYPFHPRVPTISALR